MSDRVCENCGKPTFFNHAMSRGGGDLPQGVWRHTHGFDEVACEEAAAVTEALPVLYDMAIQSLVKTSEVLGQFVAEADDADYDDPKVLQRLILGALHLASEGVGTEARWRESLEPAASEPIRPH